ncbi:hypothetical protein Pint_19841 [Pistacia integerrima]|uniref:Uncharacterized protein n=1 Tax=Pistacia integerrima TaxID=434235 RepID=A0ACC0X810_9ROSI|nr:hypothetical protein Pint_19841 [Pistacia integerrima]
MRHKIFLKLIGCCLETEAPILVFEHVENGTLADRIYRSSEPHFEPLLLTHRLKIAMEIANAIAYLHFGFSRPIIFRSIDTETIVFTEQYVAKLFDFSLAIAIPEGETHVEDEMAGTYGFLAPECIITQKLNEKVDVYGFGVILLELLTGLKSVQRPSSPTETHSYDSPSSPAETHSYDSPIRSTETHFDGPLERDDSPSSPAETHSDDSPMRPTETHFDGPLERDDSPIRPTETHFDGPLERDDSPIRRTETHFDGPLERDDSPIRPTETHFDGPLERDDSSYIDFLIRRLEIHFDGPLARVVKKYIEQDRFTEIVDPIVVGSGLSPEKEEQLQAFAELAFKCISSPVDRPTMIDVAKQLRHIYKSTCQLMS